MNEDSELSFCWNCGGGPNGEAHDSKCDTDEFKVKITMETQKTWRERFDENKDIQMPFTNLSIILHRPGQKNGGTASRKEVERDIEAHKSLIISFIKTTIAEERKSLAAKVGKKRWVISKGIPTPQETKIVEAHNKEIDDLLTSLKELN